MLLGVLATLISNATTIKESEEAGEDTQNFLRIPRHSPSLFRPNSLAGASTIIAHTSEPA